MLHAQAWRAVSGSLKSAGRWLEPWGNPGPRGMIVIGSDPRNRTRLIGQLHFFALSQGLPARKQSRKPLGGQLPAPVGLFSASISASTRAGARSFMHLKCISGHSRAKQGLHSMSMLTMRANPACDSGGVCAGLDDPYNAISGFPSAAATCIRPESLLTTSLAQDMRSIAAARSVLPHRFLHVSPDCARISSPSPASLAEPISQMP